MHGRTLVKASLITAAVLLALHPFPVVRLARSEASAVRLPAPPPEQRPLPPVAAEPTVVLVPPPSLLASPPSVANALLVREENAKPGSAGWRITNYAATGEIQAYAGAVSVNAGNSLDFYVSTRTPGIVYRIDIYRMGWYGGLGARLQTSVPNLTGIAQGFYTGSTGLVGCGRCHGDATTGLLEANWLPSYRLTVPEGWLSGVYLAQLTESRGKQTYVPFVVRQDQRASALLVQASVNTYEAYNAWGGKSLYSYNSAGAPTVGGSNGAVKVSFNRPFDADMGSGQFLRYEYNLVRWLERQGYDAAYTTNVDVAADPAVLSRHRAFISAGHDEYWTANERQNTEDSLAHGLQLAFLGGDSVYWQARYEPSAAGVANRTLVVYRGRSDPLFADDPVHATVTWASAPVNRPQNRLTGELYGGQLLPFVQDWVAGDTHHWLFDGTWLRPGDHVPGIVGKEFDRAGADGSGPIGLRVLAHSGVTLPPVPGRSPESSFADTTVYTAASGATVFSAGTITWSWGLDDASFPVGALHSTPVSAALQRLTANLLDLFSYGLPNPP